MIIKMSTIAAAFGILASLLVAVGASASDTYTDVLTAEARAAHEELVAASKTGRPGDPEWVTTRYHVSSTISWEGGKQPGTSRFTYA